MKLVKVGKRSEATVRKLVMAVARQGYRVAEDETGTSRGTLYGLVEANRPLYEEERKRLGKPTAAPRLGGIAHRQRPAHKADVNLMHITVDEKGAKVSMSGQGWAVARQSLLKQLVALAIRTGGELMRGGHESAAFTFTKGPQGWLMQEA